MAFNDIYSSRRVLKWGLVIVSALLVGYFLYFSNNLVKDLSEQERDRMQIWADATKELVSMSVATESSPANVNFLLSIIEANDNIPVLLVDENDNILDHRNFQLPDANDSVSYYGMLSDVNKAFLDGKLRGLKHSSNRIDIQIDEDITHNLYYEDSTLLRRLQFYPYVLLGVLVVFVLVVYFALMSIKKAEQNKVWVGLSKETAHQLGTPISSLMAWMQMLETTDLDSSIVEDMNKDVNRLSIIADRFSKIGSKPEMELAFVNESVVKSLEYMRTRISQRVKLNIHTGEDECGVLLCMSLFEWVMENLTKNAVDAMQGEGKIDITVSSNANTVQIDVADTGKGIARKNFGNVFNPGYTTKKRGWGLGLTLVKRIIEEYHGGRIYVKESELGKGTTFRIELPRA
ncbi:MAG: HAMP domain-containing sensor histidine kinase [Muribaculaceae bacterium]|nr:HAMP domain-containing sensor histidine kinase [Muribaculaceae bacterium]